jgi:hypothetical protein
MLPGPFHLDFYLTLFHFLVEKERTDREREAALVAAQGRIASLENQMGSLETSRKRARIDFEADVESLKFVRMV